MKISEFPVSAGVDSTVNFLGCRDSGGGVFVDELFTADEVAAFTGTMGIVHLVGAGGTPTVVAGTGAGTGATITIDGDDLGGVILVTTGTGCASSALLATVTFNTPYGAQPKCIILTPAILSASILAPTKQAFIYYNGSTTLHFQIFTGTTALSDATQYAWHYLVKQ